MPSDCQKRLLIYLHYNPRNRLDPYVEYQINAFRQYGMDIIFISNSTLNPDDRRRIEALTDKVVERDNSGVDFTAWKLALLDLGPDGLARYSELILMNDSTYGPLFPLHELFESMSKTGADFWGITSEIHPEVGECIHSYFYDFRPDVFMSQAFWNFWRHLPEIDGFWDSVHKGEQRLTSVLNEAGFVHGVFADIPDILPLPAIGPDVPFSRTIVPWLIKNYRIPFIKSKAFDTRPGKQFNEGRRIFRALTSAGSSYPAELIPAHLVRSRPLSWSKNQPDFLNTFSLKGDILPNPGLKLAAFVHLHYPDQFEEMLTWLKHIPYPFDLYISTTSEANKKALLAFDLKSHIRAIAGLKVRVFENQGRDVAPWLLGFKDVQQNYELALKFHLKKSPCHNRHLLHEWSRFINKCTLGSAPYVSRVIDLFTRRHDLGMAFHPYPPALLLSFHNYFVGDETTRSCFEKTLKTCGITEIVETSFPLFPQNIFWYRPTALARLFESDISLGDFPPEPYPLDGATGHGLERAIPYIVQQQGFANAHIIPKELLIASFQQYEDHIIHSEPAGWIKGEPAHCAWR